jgi:serine/threonine protein kinase
MPKLEKHFEKFSHEARDLLLNLLVINPEERLSSFDALNHPFITKHQNFY